MPTLRFCIDPKDQFINNVHPTTLGCLQISGLVDPKQDILVLTHAHCQGQLSIHYLLQSQPLLSWHSTYTLLKSSNNFITTNRQSMAKSSCIPFKIPPFLPLIFFLAITDISLLTKGFLSTLKKSFNLAAKLWDGIFSPFYWGQSHPGGFQDISLMAYRGKLFSLYTFISYCTLYYSFPSLKATCLYLKSNWCLLIGCFSYFQCASWSTQLTKHSLLRNSHYQPSQGLFKRKRQCFLKSTPTKGFIFSPQPIHSMIV